PRRGRPMRDPHERDRPLLMMPRVPPITDQHPRSPARAPLLPGRADVSMPLGRAPGDAPPRARPRANPDLPPRAPQQLAPLREWRLRLVPPRERDRVLRNVLHALGVREGDVRPEHRAFA